jgi:protein SCO1/2
LFGFTHCPDVCPTGLMEMSRWAEELGDKADELRFIFVTVDPERDTQQVMNDYVTAFSERIIGVTGDAEDVHAMVKDYKIYSRKVAIEGGDYTMDHTASMILQDAQGNFAGTIDRSEAPEAALAKLNRLVAG